MELSCLRDQTIPFFTAPICFVGNIHALEGSILCCCELQYVLEMDWLRLKIFRLVALCNHRKLEYPSSGVQVVQALDHGFLPLCWFENKKDPLLTD